MFKINMKERLERSVEILEQRKYVNIEIEQRADTFYIIHAKNEANGHVETFRVTAQSFDIWDMSGKWQWKNIRTFNSTKELNASDYFDQMRKIVNENKK